MPQESQTFREGLALSFLPMDEINNRWRAELEAADRVGKLPENARSRVYEDAYEKLYAARRTWNTAA